MPIEYRAVADTARSGAAAMDTTTQQWLAGLRASGRENDQYVAALHALLLRVARHEVSRRAASLQLHGPELEDIAQQASDDALMAIRSKIAGFRGDSRFTTWAYKFVMFEVSTKMARHFWRHRHASMDADGWERLPDRGAAAPDQRTEHREIFDALRTAIDQELTRCSGVFSLRSRSTRYRWTPWLANSAPTAIPCTRCCSTLGVNFGRACGPPVSNVQRSHLGQRHEDTPRHRRPAA